jgi:hypothetical protein
MATGKGKKRVRNIPVLHDQPKRKHTIWLTDDAWYSVQELAVKQKISASEYLEELIRKHCITVG